MRFSWTGTTRSVSAFFRGAFRKGIKPIIVMFDLIFSTPLAPDVLTTTADLPMPPSLDGSVDVLGSPSGARSRAGDFAPPANDKNLLKSPKTHVVG
ncbi:hypothetical protein K488DRAFT_92371 [Vararia minispora EC-137]|uniref:Uncharacterized protein n=1 Tax=Vararia minispora EC-137 TaxID=1314806 RepID=A0ACB8Q479_9AGAM|nr:hypothetical protein K488DRAFT_92371 [Vararia minispora EC-137]